MGAPDRRTLFIVIAASVMACAFWVALGVLSVPEAKEHDFLSFYTGASLGLGALYDTAAQSAFEQHVRPDPGRPLIPFIRPPFYALFIAPLAWLPYDAAFSAWLAIQCIVLAWCWFRAWRRFGPQSLLFCALFLPTGLGIPHGQDCALMMLLVLEGFLQAETDNWFLSGLLVGLTLFKPNLLLLVPFAIVIRRRWTMLAGWSLSAAAYTVLSVATGDAGDWLRLLGRTDIARLSPSPERMMSVHAIATNLGFDPFWFRAVLVVLVAVVSLRALRSGPLWRWYGIAIAGSLLLPTHVYEYDAAVLLLPALFAMTEPVMSRFGRLSAFAVVTPLPYMATIAGAPWAMTPVLVLLVFLLALVIHNGHDQPLAATPAITGGRTAIIGATSAALR